MEAMAGRPQVSIALMGGTGTGKSTFVNLAGHAEHAVGDDLESCTDHVLSHNYTFEDYDITLIDMPGFDDTSKSDSDLLRMIAEFFLQEYKEGRKLNGVLYFHRISDVRVGGTSKRNFTMFKKLCGDDMFSNIAIVTTRWDLEEKATAEKRLTELTTKSQLFKLVIDGGAEVFRHDRTYESACAIVRYMIGKTPKPLLIQHEMGEEGKELLDTAAGQELQRDIVAQVEKHEEEVSELLKELEQSDDMVALGELEDEVQALRNKMTRLQSESHKLAGTLSVGEANETALTVTLPSPTGVSFTTDTLYIQPLAESALIDRPTNLVPGPDSLSVPPPNGPFMREGADANRAVEADLLGQFKEDLRVVWTQLDEEKRCREEDHARLEGIEKMLEGVIRLPDRLIGVLNWVTWFLGQK